MKRNIFLLAILVFTGLFALQIWFRSSANTKTDQKERAIQRAMNYQPDGMCTQALVPAVHTDTGARYTFPSGCLAPGWEPIADEL